MNIYIADNPVALSNIGASLRLAGEWEKARECHYAALKLEMGHASAWMGLGQIAEDLGEFVDAVRYYTNALATRTSVKLQFQKQIALACAQARLRLGDWSVDTWTLWELGRRDASWFPFPGVPEWDRGCMVDRLLVTPEGGLGDVLWLLRHMRELPAARIGLVCPAELTALVDELAADPRVCVLGDEASPGDWDAQVPLMGIIANLRDPCEIREVSAVKGAIPTHTRRKRIGICWTASEIGVQRPHRAVPVGALETLRDCNVEWVSLTQQAHPWIGLPSGPDWTATADLVRSCDLVITTDTSVLHLAGVLGIPALALIPMRSDWKWLTPPQNHPDGIHGGREHSRWFGAVGLVRQDHPTDWSGAIAKVREVL